MRCALRPSGVKREKDSNPKEQGGITARCWWGVNLNILELKRERFRGEVGGKGGEQFPGARRGTRKNGEAISGQKISEAVRSNRRKHSWGGLDSGSQDYAPRENGWADRGH